MKTIKSNLIKLIVSLIVITLLFNFVSSSSLIAYASSEPSDVLSVDEEFNLGSFAGNLVGGVMNAVAGVLTVLFRVLLVLFGSVMHAGGVALGVSAGLTDNSSLTDAIITPEQIFFNKLNITSINFFDFSSGTGVMQVIRTQVAIWYYVFRNLSIVILLCILLYVGIRMALSTVASEKAVYKSMLQNWVVSFAIVFLLHYIIMGTIELNNSFINLLSNALKPSTSIHDALPGIILRAVNPLNFTDSWACAIIYVMMVTITFAFLLSYIKRVFTVGFLIIISPLITITYSVDKMADNKSQALDTWLKEFVYNVLIQPFHCVIYLVFCTATLSIINSSVSIVGMVLSIMALKFIWDAEKIVRKIFGFEKASTLGDSVRSAAGAVMAVKTVQTIAGKASTRVASSSGSGGNGGGTPNLQSARQASTPSALNRAATRAMNAAANTTVGKGASAFASSASSALNKARQTISNNTVGKMASSSKVPIRAMGKAMQAGGAFAKEKMKNAINGAKTATGNFVRSINGAGAHQAAWTALGAIVSYAANENVLTGASAGYAIGEVAKQKAEQRSANRIRNRENSILAREFMDIGANTFGHDMSTQDGRNTTAAAVRGIYANKAANVANYEAEYANALAREQANLMASANPPATAELLEKQAKENTDAFFENLSRQVATPANAADAAAYHAIKTKQLIDSVDRAIAVESALGNNDAENYVMNSLIDDIAEQRVEPA